MFYIGLWATIVIGNTQMEHPLTHNLMPEITKINLFRNAQKRWPENIDCVCVYECAYVRFTREKNKNEIVPKITSNLLCERAKDSNMLKVDTLLPLIHLILELVFLSLSLARLIALRVFFYFSCDTSSPICCRFYTQYCISSLLLLSPLMLFGFRASKVVILINSIKKREPKVNTQKKNVWNPRPPSNFRSRFHQPSKHCFRAHKELFAHIKYRLYECVSFG